MRRTPPIRPPEPVPTTLATCAGLQTRRRQLLATLLWPTSLSASQAFAAGDADAPVIEWLQVGGARLEVQLDPAFGLALRSLLLQWVSRAATVVAAYFGRFPLPNLEVLVLAAGPGGVQGGTAFAEPAPYLRLRVSPRTSAAQLRQDWVLVHEMTHLALPQLPRQQAWFHEGVATYVEAVARTRSRLLTPEQLWAGFAAGMPQGQPGEGDRGLDHTPTWGRTYWGGAMFCLLADVQMRQRSAGRASLQQALRGVLAAGGNYTQAWSLAKLLALADQSVGQHCLVELHASMGARAVPVALDELWRDLGVDVTAAGAVSLRNDAPLARWRMAIESIGHSPGAS